jgi:hypothetical protein
MKTLHDHYEALIHESLKANIEIYKLQQALKHVRTQNLEQELTIMDLEMKLAKYELEISRKGV